MFSMDWLQYRRLRHSLRRKSRDIKFAFQQHQQRNTVFLVLAFFFIFKLIAIIFFSSDSFEQRRRQLAPFAQNGIFGAPSDIKFNDPNDVNVKLCNIDNILCSKWGTDRVWRGEELKRDESWIIPGWIRVPIGVQVTLTMRDGRRRTLRYGQHMCDDTSLNCHDIGAMIVEESILSVIDKISEACASDHWLTEPEIVHTIRPKKPISKRDVTMVVQFSISRLDVFEKAHASWQGPSSVVIYLPTKTDIVELKKYFDRPGKLRLYESIILTIVKPNFSTGTQKRYPINHLRNIGVQTAMTDYIYVIDADFIPSSELHKFSKSSLIPIFEKSKQPLAYVVPCLAIQVDYKGRYPNTVQELQPLMKSGVAYITDPRAGHGPTFTKLFLNSPIFGGPPAYEVCYESQWEPYYIIKRDMTPYYDERFKNQGGDKQSHALLMNALGFKFLVLRDHFMYHMDHPKLKWAGDGLDKDNQKDYTYFENYSPSMEKIFGKNYRWPRGCSRPLVQSFRHDLQGLGTM